MTRLCSILIASGLILVLVSGCAPASGQSPTRTSPPTNTTDIPIQPTEEAIPVLQNEAGFPDPSQEEIPVIFLHGGAPCDIAATVYLTRHPNINLLGMVLSRGEIHPPAALESWGIFLYDVLHNQDTILALGTDDKMDPNWHDFPENWRPAADHFWGLSLPNPTYAFEPASGPELIVDLVNNSPAKVTIVAMASMVDIARALQIDPGIIDNISQVVIMGGAFTVPGNLSDDPTITDNTVAEWNMWIDAEAARYLFNSGVHLSIVPLDAIQYLVQPEDVTRMNNIDTTIHDPGAAYVSAMWNQQLDGAPDGFLIWDTITIVAVTHPELFDWVYDGVDVITEPGPTQGQTIPLNNGATHIRFATDADYDAILEQVFDVMQRGVQTTAEEPSWVTVEGTNISGLGGRWEGDTRSFHIIFSFDPVCELNAVCGTFEIPDFALTGDITFININGDVFQFQGSNYSQAISNEDLFEYLQVLANGTVRYVSSGPDDTMEAILTRE